ncbi:Exc2 family lipoprotein [Rosenbergiella collisarenosi]|uniref:Exc2 family lipoprotein n=1 Tax=Rosenbergiella collisarenosi TaxID=1544695 RepID=UPI001F4F375A
MKFKYFLALVISSYVMSGCAPTSVVGKNARHLSLQFAADNHDINTRSLTTDTQNSLEKFLQQFYDLGKKDRQKGMDMNQASQRVSSFAKNDVFNPKTQKSNYINRSYDASNPESQAKLLLNSAIETYWDGYNGVI